MFGVEWKFRVCSIKVTAVWKCRKNEKWFKSNQIGIYNLYSSSHLPFLGWKPCIYHKLCPTVNRKEIKIRLNDQLVTHRAVMHSNLIDSPNSAFKWILNQLNVTHVGCRWRTNSQKRCERIYSNAAKRILLISNFTYHHSWCSDMCEMPTSDQRLNLSEWVTIFKRISNFNLFQSFCVSYQLPSLHNELFTIYMNEWMNKKKTLISVRSIVKYAFGVCEFEHEYEYVYVCVREWRVCSDRSLHCLAIIEFHIYIFLPLLHQRNNNNKNKHKTTHTHTQMSASEARDLLQPQHDRRCMSIVASDR